MITNKHLTQVSTHQFATDASNVGLPPGHWPAKIETNIGNKLPLVFKSYANEAYTYVQECGCIEVVIFND